MFAAGLGDALVGVWPTAGATGALQWYVTLDIAVVNDLFRVTPHPSTWTITSHMRLIKQKSGFATPVHGYTDNAKGTTQFKMSLLVVGLLSLYMLSSHNTHPKATCLEPFLR